MCIRDRERGFCAKDCLVGIAAGGTTPYVRGGLAFAKSIGALAIAMACVPTEQAPLPCDIDNRLLTGPELLTGSTRMKAGTATKLALITPKDQVPEQTRSNLDLFTAPYWGPFDQASAS